MTSSKKSPKKKAKRVPKKIRGIIRFVATIRNASEKKSWASYIDYFCGEYHGAEQVLIPRGWKTNELYILTNDVGEMKPMLEFMLDNDKFKYSVEVTELTNEQNKQLRLALKQSQKTLWNKLLTNLGVTA